MKKTLATLALTLLAFSPLASQSASAQVFGIDVGNGITVGMDQNGNPFVSGGTGNSPIRPLIVDPFVNPQPVVNNPIVPPPPIVKGNPQPVFNPQPQPVFNPQPQPVFNPQPQPVFNPQPQPVFNPQPQPVFNPQPRPVFNPQHVQPWNPTFPTQPVNPVIDRQDNWVWVTDPRTGQLKRIRKSDKIKSSALDPNRNVIDPGSLRTTTEQGRDRYGRPVMVKVTSWTSYGVRHYNREVVTKTQQGLDIDTTTAGPKAF